MGEKGERKRGQQAYSWEPKNVVKENHGNEKVMSPMGKYRHTRHAMAYR